MRAYIRRLGRWLAGPSDANTQHGPATRELAQLKDELLSQVAHELRAPLTIIQGYAELLAEGQLSEPLTVRTSAREIQASARRMLTSIDDLVVTPRLEAGRIELHTERVDLAAWLARATEAFAAATPAHTIVAELSNALPAVRVDLDRLGPVIDTLLSNAADCSEPGTLIVLTAHVFEAGIVEIQVIDQGASRVGGGLGEALARAVVQAHGGEIGVRSTPGRGSTVWMRLPSEVASLPSQPPEWIDPAALAA